MTGVRWLRCAGERPGPRLVCLPHAGGSASFYRDWAAALPEVELHVVQYPGRADRIHEDPPTDLPALAGAIANEVAGLADRPLVLFGHSMGAVVAFELARLLVARDIPPRHLFASGARAAHDPACAPEGLSEADDDAIMAELAALGGTHIEMLDDPMLRDLVLPYVRADFLMFDRYEFRPGPPLDCPITTVNGADDDHVSPDRAALWRELTAGPFATRELPGEHFYLNQQPPFEILREAIAALDKAGHHAMTDRSPRPTAVLVDAYTSGNYLPPAFARLDADLVHVLSTPEPLGSMTPPNWDAYSATLTCDTPEATAARLREYAPVSIVAGQEPGVPLADRLAELLGLPGNSTELSLARRDKYEMIEALRRAGLHCADQVKTDDAEEAVAWAVRRADWPVVVKPLSSAATDGVAICESPEQVRKAAAHVLATSSIFAEPNREVLVQSFLAGEEYVVDTVSHDGRRYTCGVWQYRKRLLDTHNIYDREVLMAADEDPVPELITYVHDALDALGIRHGPAHAEVMLTPDGPALVEVGARMAGNMHPGFHDECLGANQADVTALACVAPGEFFDRHAGRAYRKVCEADVYTVPTELDGVVAEIDDAVVAEIEALDSVYGLNLKLKPGSRIRPTVDLYTSTMRIFLLGDTAEALERDYRRIQQLADRVYVLR